MNIAKHIQHAPQTIAKTLPTALNSQQSSQILISNPILINYQIKEEETKDGSPLDREVLQEVLYLCYFCEWCLKF